MSNTTMLNEALSYAKRGWAVFPLVPKSKNPMTANGFKSATTTEAAIREWWTDEPNANIGIACGSVSGGLVVVDIDVDEAKGEDGMEALREWEHEHGELLETVSAITGRGGCHLFYKFSQTVKCSANPEIGIDIRGDGGYIVAPPSVHPTGTRYEWENHPDDFEIATSDKNVIDFVDYVRPIKKERERIKAPKTLKEGGRNNTLYKMACSLQAQDWDDDAIVASIETYNKMSCKPPLPDVEVKKIIDSALSLEKGKSEEVKKATSNQFNHSKFADELMREKYVCFIDGMPSIWNGKSYSVGWDKVESAMIDKKADIRANARIEVRKYLVLRAPKNTAAHKRFVAFENGVLDVLSGELKEPSPDMYISNVIPHNWNPNAECDAVDSMLNRVACDDEEIYQNLVEAIGICMYRGSEFAKCPILIGEGSNGKSTFINMLRNLLGRDNCSSQDMATIGERFQTVPLMGKLANLGDDIGNDFISGSKASVVKKVITGDEVQAEYKGGETFSFRPYCTLVFSVNEMPRLGDSGNGMMRRLHPIPFNARFTKADPDYNPNIEEDLSTKEALERLCVIGVMGIQSCIQNKGLKDNSTTEQLVKEISLENDTVLQFLEEVDEAEFIESSTATAYGDYKRYCENSGLREASKNTFSKKVCKKLDLETYTKKVDGRVARFFKRKMR